MAKPTPAWLVSSLSFPFKQKVYPASSVSRPSPGLFSSHSIAISMVYISHVLSKLIFLVVVLF